jgi:hypothetical protein
MVGMIMGLGGGNQKRQTVSFYLSTCQANAVRAWYWTPERFKASGIKVVSSEEMARIKSELGIENIESIRCGRIQCDCGHAYGAFEFLQQGAREHGVDAVAAVFALTNSTFLRANPFRVLAIWLPMARRRRAVRLG